MYGTYESASNKKRFYFTREPLSIDLVLQVALSQILKVLLHTCRFAIGKLQSLTGLAIHQSGKTTTGSPSTHAPAPFFSP